jgi:hypothetical protein
MAIQIVDSVIADKVDRVAKATGLSMTAVVELALDLWLSEMAEASHQSEHMAARIAQLDGTPYRAGASESIQ